MAGEIGHYCGIDFIGGGIGAVDKIHGSVLQDKDAFLVVTSSVFAPLSLDADSGAGENSPLVISPNLSAGDKRWILSSGIFAGMTLYGDLTLSGATAVITVGGASWGKLENQTKLFLNYDNPTANVQVGKNGNSLDFSVHGDVTVGELIGQHPLSVSGIIASHVGTADESHERFRLARAVSPTLRFHSIYGKNSAIADGNNITFKVHDAVTTTSQVDVLTLRGDGAVILPNGTLYLKEQAAADADIGAHGQLWVKTATPNELWFTDDAGGDHQIAFVA